MFNNIGSKIKSLAILVSVGGIISSILTGLILLIALEEMGALIGIVIAVVGSALSWIGSFYTYGFGELIENSSIIAKSGNKAPAPFPNARPNMNMPQNSRPVNNNQNFVQAPKDSRLQNLENLRAQNLITEEEYRRKVDSINFEQRNGR